MKPTYAELVEALEEAREDLEHWANYADPYFQEKWGLADDLKRIDAVIAAADGPLTYSVVPQFGFDIQIDCAAVIDTAEEPTP